LFASRSDRTLSSTENACAGFRPWNGLHLAALNLAELLLKRLD
jgi:hypothetical protein